MKQFTIPVDGLSVLLQKNFYMQGRQSVMKIGGGGQTPSPRAPAEIESDAFLPKNLTSGGNNSNDVPENQVQLIKFRAI